MSRATSIPDVQANHYMELIVPLGKKRKISIEYPPDTTIEESRKAANLFKDLVAEGKKVSELVKE